MSNCTSSRWQGRDLTFGWQTLRPFDFIEKVGCKLFEIVEFSFALTIPFRRPGFEETLPSRAISSILNAAQ